jgi:hypothetical protein
MTSPSKSVRAQRWFAALSAIALVACGLVLGAAPAMAAGCVVNSNQDNPAANAATGCDSTLGAGIVTLRSAIEHFSSVDGDNVITFSGPSTISLGGLGAFVDGDTGTLTITGAGIDQTIIDAHNASRIFDSASGPIVISGMTLEHSQGSDTAVFNVSNLAATSLKITGSVVNSANVNGGVVDGGTVSFTSSLIDGTTVTSTDGSIHGAVFDTGDLTLTDTLVTNTNITVEPGNNLDGVADTGNVTMLRSAIVGTTANIGDRSSVFGGIFDSGGVSLDHSALGDFTLTAGVTATIHGGLLDSGDATILDSTIGHSRITTGTGAVVTGALFDTGTITLTNATIADNITTLGANSTNGNGNFDTGGVTAKNTIIANNGPANCGAVFASSDHSLDSGSTCGMGSINGNISNRDPGLGAFQLNSPGTTQTMAIGATSPAYNTANNANCPSTDQRGVTRIFPGDATCDMGAYEFVAAVVASPSPSPTATVAPALPKAGGPASPRGLGAALLIALVTGLGALAAAYRLATRR